MDRVASVPLEPLNMRQVPGRNQPLPDDDDPVESQIPMSQIPLVRFSLPNYAIGSSQPSWEMSCQVPDSMPRENDEAIADAIIGENHARLGDSGSEVRTALAEYVALTPWEG
ncbi:hypothetical protein R1flu_014016 [Riccia fluitans]|uniref:Uncharacterized protein n=1 Tax=Riccia fluitans TaxID=41844 RepID=A0ABD1YF78_9MARC